MKNKDYYIEEYIEYLYGDIPEDDRPLHQPEITQSRADFKSGFNLAEELFKPKWISVEKQLPKLNQQVMIRFIKSNKTEVITQGCMRNVAKETADKMKEGFDKNDCEITKEKFKYAITEEYWVERGYGLAWYNYSNIKIQNLTKKSNNTVIEWSEIIQ